MRTAILNSIRLGVWGVLIAGCGDDSAVVGGANAGGANQGGQGGNNGVCIQHNCADDTHCEGCADGRNSCRIEAGQTSGSCVACGKDGKGCPAGQECSSFGNCVPEGLECATDDKGVPQITCESSADCAACDPQHLVCEPASRKCVACTESDTAECQSTDICVAGVCSSACASDCHVDNNCSQCAGAPACNNHKCSECSATYACPSDQHCDLTTGTCEKNCGDVVSPGVCDNDEDCGGCAGSQTTCHLPVNGGPGTCGPDVAGCTDLGGAGALELPAPFNQITNTCSSDANCDGAGVMYNVGKALRDLLETDSIFGQDIADANVFYPMNACAAITIADTSCGVCVPCRDDSDCGDVDLDMLAGDLFPGVGGALLAVVFDQVFGDNPHSLFMYCEGVAAGYGVCVPCPGLLNDCAPDFSGGSGTCDHPATETGTALDPACDDCAATVCGFDTFCCETAWDETCVQEGIDNCGASACHDPCQIGEKMGAECGTCEGDVCAFDAYCCETTWDSQCVDEAQATCSLLCE